MATPTFDMQGVITSIIGQADEVVANESSTAALSIYWTLFFFHVVQAAAEFSQGAACRFADTRFWLRLCLVGGILAGYRPIFVGLAREVQPRMMLSFGTTWIEVWEQENKAITAARQAEAENEELKYGEVGASKTGKDDDSWFAKVARYVGNFILGGLGWLVSIVVGLLITVLILMEGFFALGINMLLLAIGPLCIAFAAHEKTEGIFYSFFKAFFVFGLVYMPILGFACSFGGVVMSRISRMGIDSDAQWGDGSDFAVHFILLVVGPLLTLAVVRAAPALLNSLIGSANLGGGSAGGATAQAANLAATAARGSAGDTPAPDESAKEKDNRGGGGDGGGPRGWAGMPLQTPGAGEGAPSVLPESAAKEVRGE